jgi:hypothetical protein
MVTDLNQQLNSGQPIPRKAAAIYRTLHRPWAVDAAQKMRNKFGINIWVDGTVMTGWKVLVHPGDFERAKRMFASTLGEHRRINEAVLLALTLLEDEGGWLGVDLDGTLAKYTDYKGKTTIGEPIPAMVNRIRRWVGHGKKVKIFTARARDEEGVAAIKKWLKKHELPDLEVTNIKDHKMICFYDDKAIQVQKNTGKLR